MRSALRAAVSDQVILCLSLRCRLSDSQEALALGTVADLIMVIRELTQQNFVAMLRSKQVAPEGKRVSKYATRTQVVQVQAHLVCFRCFARRTRTAVWPVPFAKISVHCNNWAQKANLEQA